MTTKLDKLLTLVRSVSVSISLSMSVSVSVSETMVVRQKKHDDRIRQAVDFGKICVCVYFFVYVCVRVCV